jgi:hypothetical protein
MVLFVAAAAAYPIAVGAMSLILRRDLAVSGR